MSQKGVLRCCVLVVWISMSATAVELNFEAYQHPDAVCNDGSRSGLYFAPAADANSDVWVVQLQGGGWCWNQKSCAARKSDMVSSKDWPQSMTPDSGSILDANGTDYANANKVYQRYCTSDGYIGNATASAATSGLHFQGHAVVNALLQTLVGKGMGRSRNATLILSGCSAGGRGVMHNTNFAGAFAAQHGVQSFTSLIDSGLYIDIEPIQPDPTDTGIHTPLRDQAKGIVAYNHAAVDPSCASTYPGDEWKCLIGEYAVPTLKYPILLHAFQDDFYQLGIVDFKLPYPAFIVRKSQTLSGFADTFRNRTIIYGLYSYGPVSISRHLPQQDYMVMAYTVMPLSRFVDTFCNRTRSAVFRALDPTARLAPHVGVHSATCYHHCNTEGSTFSTGFTVEGTPLSQVVQTYMLQ